MPKSGKIRPKSQGRKSPGRKSQNTKGRKSQHKTQGRKSPGRKIPNTKGRKSPGRRGPERTSRGAKTEEYDILPMNPSLDLYVFCQANEAIVDEVNEYANAEILKGRKVSIHFASSPYNRRIVISSIETLNKMKDWIFHDPATGPAEKQKLMSFGMLNHPWPVKRIKPNWEIPFFPIKRFLENNSTSKEAVMNPDDYAEIETNKKGLTGNQWQETYNEIRIRYVASLEERGKQYFIDKVQSDPQKITALKRLFETNWKTASPKQQNEALQHFYEKGKDFEADTLIPAFKSTDTKDNESMDTVLRGKVLGSPKGVMGDAFAVLQCMVGKSGKDFDGDDVKPTNKYLRPRFSEAKVWTDCEEDDLWGILLLQIFYTLVIVKVVTSKFMSNEYIQLLKQLFIKKGEYGGMVSIDPETVEANVNFGTKMAQIVDVPEHETADGYGLPSNFLHHFKIVKSRWLQEQTIMKPIGKALENAVKETTEYASLKIKYKLETDYWEKLYLENLCWDLHKHVFTVTRPDLKHYLEDNFFLTNTFKELG